MHPRRSPRSTSTFIVAVAVNVNLHAHAHDYVLATTTDIAAAARGFATNHDCGVNVHSAASRIPENHERFP
jgi:hypothetical protein